MSLKDIKEGIGKKKVAFGIKQAVKLSKGKGKVKVFAVRDVRPETVAKLEKAKIKVEDLGRMSKEEVARELDLDFESEVYTLK